MRGRRPSQSCCRLATDAADLATVLGEPAADLAFWMRRGAGLHRGACRGCGGRCRPPALPQSNGWLAIWPCRWTSLPARPGKEAAVDRLLRGDQHARPQLLRPAGLRGAAGQPVRHRQGRRGDPALVPAGPGRDAGGGGIGADLVVGQHVRISDAVAGHARACRIGSGTDQPADRGRARGLWRGAATCPGASRNPPTTPAIWK